MTTFCKLFGISFMSFLIIDGLWLGLVARNFYQQQIGSLLKTDVNWIAAIVFYVIFVCGLVIFVVQPALSKLSWQYAALHGALFGLVTYATYDLTNLAVAKDWPLSVTIVDLIWGTILAASVATITVVTAQKFQLV